MDPNANKNEPTGLRPANPGPNPRPDGCKCVWTPLDLGWVKGSDNPKCPVHGSE